MTGSGLRIRDGIASRIHRYEFEGAEALTHAELMQRATTELNFSGTEGADRVAGTNLADSLSGYGGDDALEGQGGNDYLDGGAGAEVCSRLH